MPIVLPSSPAPRSANVRLVTSVAELRSALGGSIQRINRKGSHFAIDYVMPPMEYEQAMTWIGLLAAAMVDTVIMPFPQGAFDAGPIGSPVVDGSGHGGTMLPVRGLTPATPIVTGQVFTLVKADGRYNYIVTQPATADGNGKATLRFAPMLRRPPADGDEVLIAAPEIEGFATPAGSGWSMDTARHVGLAFTVEERN
uniref:Putative tail protein n=1 Tax=viral metagenome TaxID=1070528 RepID=A0A6H1ZSQ3_9ZZZZ